MSCHTESCKACTFSLFTVLLKLSYSSKGQSLFPTENTTSPQDIAGKSVYFSLLRVVWQSSFQGIYGSCLYQQCHSALPQQPATLTSSSVLKALVGGDSAALTASSVGECGGPIICKKRGKKSKCFPLN